MMLNLRNECEFMLLSSAEQLAGFDCGDDDLNEFFNIDAIKYQEQMLGQTYLCRHNQSGKIVGAFSLSPHGLQVSDLPNSRRKKVKENIPNEKPLKAYSAYLIGRLGVSVEFSGQGIGSQMLDFIKYFCFGNYQCRFLVVDAYNKPEVLHFYQKNGFQTVFSTEEQEQENKRLNGVTSLRTRYMFFDMIHWKNKGSETT
jgi:ribosomal protein S18 acetylase RimI-like enzyme